MNLSQIEHIVSSSAVLTTILQFLSGTLVCKQYVANKTTGESPVLPFLCGVVSSGLWLLYGLAKQDDPQIIVNIVGLVLMAAYTVVFYIYTFKKTMVLKQIFLGVSCLLFFIGYYNVEKDNELLINRLGLIACSLTLLTIAAPMSKLFYVVRVKSTECLPFPMILMSFFVSALWFLYGEIKDDAYLLLPNFIGAVLALAQLSLFLIYSNNPPSPSLVKTILA